MTTTPTTARPGTREKVAVLAARAAKRLPLFVAGDCDGPAATPAERAAWLARLADEQAEGMAAMRRAGRTWAEVARAFGVTAEAARRAVLRSEGRDAAARRREAKAEARRLTLAGRVLDLHRRGWPPGRIAWVVGLTLGQVLEVLAANGPTTGN